MATIRMPSNIKLRRDEVGRGKEPIYDELLEDFFATEAEWKRRGLKGLAFIIVPKDKMMKKNAETMRVMLNERLEAWGPEGKEKNLRPEVKVRARLLTEKLRDESPEDFEGFELREKVVFIETRDQENDPYDKSEKGIAKTLGETEETKGTAPRKAKPAVPKAKAR